MILSNVDILHGLKDGSFSIDPFPGEDPGKPPFNTSSVDLRLGEEILVLEKIDPVQLDLRKPGIAHFLHKNSKHIPITERQPFTLIKGDFVLGTTLERVNFPIHLNGLCYSARIEGKSSIARCGILVHFTAPTIHAGFSGNITLEILNMGALDFLLIPGMFICQLIIEEVKGYPVNTPNQFVGQDNPAGVVK